MGNETLLRIGSIISAPHWGLWLGFAMVVVFSLVALRGMTTYTKIINGMLILPAIGSLLMIIFMARGPSGVAATIPWWSRRSGGADRINGRRN